MTPSALVSEAWLCHHCCYCGARPMSLNLWSLQAQQGLRSSPCSSGIGEISPPGEVTMHHPRSPACGSARFGVEVNPFPACASSKSQRPVPGGQDGSPHSEKAPESPGVSSELSVHWLLAPLLGPLPLPHTHNLQVTQICSREALKLCPGPIWGQHAAFVLQWGTVAAWG